MKDLPITDIERAVGGVLDDQTRLGKRFVRRVMWGMVLLVTAFCVGVIALIEIVKRVQ